MASGKKLGFFWGEKKFHIVETLNNVPVLVAPIVLQEKESRGPEDTRGSDVIQRRLLDSKEGEYSQQNDIHITALIQKRLRDERISSGPIRLSIPARDCIIRSFVLPHMKPQEIASAVEYEVRKFIPFNLKDLNYAYHSFPLMEKKVKKLGIIFVASRRKYLDRIINILEQAGLSAVVTEPSPMSLVRALAAKKLLPVDQKMVAILALDAGSGRIMFVQEGIVSFIREFSLVPPANLGQEDTDGLLKAGFLNEVQNSMDFYNRQHVDRDPVTRIIAISSRTPYPYVLWLQEDSGLTVTEVNVEAICGSQPGDDQMAIVNAYGVSLAVEGGAKVLFNLSRKTVKHASAFSEGFSFDLGEYMAAVKTAVVCAVGLAVVFALTQWGLAGPTKSLEELKSQQGAFTDMTVDTIQTKIEQNEKRLEHYKNLPLKSRLNRVLFYTSSVLPQGVWLTRVNLKVSNSAWSQDISGFAYAVDPNQEFQQVNDLIGKIRSHEQLSKYFTNVKSSDLRRQQIDGKTVVAFSISCS